MCISAAVGLGLYERHEEKKAERRMEDAQREAQRKAEEEARAARASSAKAERAPTNIGTSATKRAHGVQSTFLASRLNGGTNNLGA